MKLLAVSQAFPPLAYPRSIQVARLLKHSSASTTLFCADEPEARFDPTIEPDAEATLEECVRIPVKTTAVTLLVNRISYRFYRPMWTRRNLSPDKYTQWRRDVVSEILLRHKRGDLKPDAVVTFGQPFSSHIAGLEIKERTGIPWLAHFSDPWADNPFSNFDVPTKAANVEMEKSVIENADMCVFTSAETIEQVFAKYPEHLREKTRVLPQCFDPAQYSDGGETSSDTILVRYLGNFYGDRSPKPLIEALETICERSPQIVENVRFELIGSGDPDPLERFGTGKLSNDVFAVHPSVEYAESLRMMSASDGLLIIDAPAEKSVFLPSKLIDYIGAGKPVFGFTPKGTARKLIEELGGSFSDPQDKAEGAEKLAGFIGQLRDRRKSGNSVWGCSDVRGRFTAEKVAADFDRMLEGLM